MKNARKPNVFIGSSSEALDVAKEIAESLGERVEVRLWSDRLFEMGEDFLSPLLRSIQGFDFAILVCSEDDTTKSRGEKTKSPRDNVMFELGLFMGSLGKRRTFPVVVRSSKKGVKIPSDLLGQSMLSISKGKLRGADEFDEKMSWLQDVILRRFREEAEFELLPSTGSAVSYFYNFLVPVCQSLVRTDKIQIGKNEEEFGFDEFEFRVLMPNSLREANRQCAELRVKELSLEEVRIAASNRTYPFHASVERLDGRLIFWDYPTILKASDEAVDHVTRGAFLGDDPIRDVFDARELTNFEKSISLLLKRESDAALFRDRVLLVRV